MKKILSFFIKYRKLTFLLAISWTILIFIGCSMPGKSLPHVAVFTSFDKFVHFTFFAGFFVLWYLYFPQLKNKALYLIWLSAFYGYAIEFYQLYFANGRSFDIFDGVADTVGAVCAWLVIRKFMPMNK